MKTSFKVSQTANGIVCQDVLKTVGRIFFSYFSLIQVSCRGDYYTLVASCCNEFVASVL